MNNSTKNIIIVVLAIIAIIAVVFALAARKTHAPQVTNQTPLSPVPTQPTQPTTDTEEHPLITVTTPTAGQRITSPLTINGKARGNWFYEASFPVLLKDANGKTLATGIATAQGEWMTTNFVPFTAQLNFNVSTTSNGTLVLIKDNPSGLPENDDQISIPIVFSK